MDPILTDRPITASGVVGAWRSVASDLVSLTKPRLSSLVLFTGGGGFWLAESHRAEGASVWAALGGIGGLSLLVGGANTLNNYLERDVDRAMLRTRDRALPAGRLDPTTALLWGLVLVGISLPLIGFLANPLSAILGLIALVLYVGVYTPLKRRSAIATFVGAIPGALPPLIGWTAASGTIDLGGVVLFAILFLWQMPHFHAIGMYRKKEYADAGLATLATESGDEAVRQQVLVFAVALVVTVPLLYPLGVGGLLTQAVGLLLGLGFVALGWKGLVEGLGNRWARNVFLYSLVYLTGLFVVLGVEAM
jgi:protoheme IX farnesyltransferase